MAELTGTPLDDFEGDKPAGQPAGQNDPQNLIPPDGGEAIDLSTIDPKDYGGDRFDANGNLIKDNKIYKSKEALLEEHKIKNPGKTAEIKVEEPAEEEYSLDKDGNLVTKKGEIYKKKGEFEVKEDGTVELKEAKFVESLIEIAKTKGYDFKDETGNPIEFEDTEEGYFGVAEYLGEMKAISFINEMLESSPELKRHYLHIQAGGDSTDFYKARVEQPDYSKLVVDDTVATQERILRDKYKNINNMTDANSQEIIDLLKASGSLDIKAKEALAELQNWQKAKVEESENAVQAQLVAQKEAKLKTLTEINEVVNKGMLGDINIPDNKKNDFYKYLTTEIEPGTTKAVKDYNSLPMEKKLMLEYLLFSGLNVDELVKIKVAREKADVIRQRVHSSRPIKLTSNAALRTSGDPGSIEDIQ